MRSAPFAVGLELGNQPSPMRPMRRTTWGAPPPNHTGMDFAGRGLMPAWVMSW